jgi:citrate synthase
VSGHDDRLGAAYEMRRRILGDAYVDAQRGSQDELLELIAEKAAARYDRDLPINATGAVGAIASDLGLPWNVTRGLGVMARAVGLVAHVLEETKVPIASEIWTRVDREVTDAHAG